MEKFDAKPQFIFSRKNLYENEKIARTAKKIHANENRSIEQMMKFKEEKKEK